MRAARFSAVELIRFAGVTHAAFEARFVAGAETTKGTAGAARSALAGVDELLASVTDDAYRHHLLDIFDGLAAVAGLTVFWGTTGCSLRVPVPDRTPLSIGWIFPPGPPRWMGLTDVTLGWYEDANGLVVGERGRNALDAYLARLRGLPGGIKPKPAAIRGCTFPPAAVVANATELQDSVREVVLGLLAS